MVLLFLKFFLKYMSVQYNVHLEYVQGGFLAYTTLVIDLEHVLLMKYLHPMVENLLHASCKIVNNAKFLVCDF